MRLQTKPDLNVKKRRGLKRGLVVMKDPRSSKVSKYASARAKCVCVTPLSLRQECGTSAVDSRLACPHCNEAACCGASQFSQVIFSLSQRSERVRAGACCYFVSAAYSDSHPESQSFAVDITHRLVLSFSLRSNDGI